MLLHAVVVVLSCLVVANAQTPCGGTFDITDGTPTIITSPNYPNNYPDASHCTYIVRTPTSDSFKGIQIDASGFDLEANCNYDYVEAYEADGTSIGGRHCGKTGPSRLVSAGNSITVIFKSDSSVNGKGFTLSFTLSQCRQGEGVCPNHPDVCLPEGAWCNGKKECPDGADEKCPEAGSCGQSTAKPDLSDVSRIAGGDEAVAHSWPWQVAMLSASGSQICGGTIVSENWILTAAHCCQASTPLPTSYKVRVGAHNLGSQSEGSVVHSLSKLVVHPSYNRPVRFANDVCLLKTATPIKFTPNVQRACIPKAEVPVGETTWVSGWGNTGAFGRDFEQFMAIIKDIETGIIPKESADNLFRGVTKLRQVDLKIMSQSDCQRTMGTTISPDMLCAVNTDKSGCNGDSGGPLVYADPADSLFYVHGAVSWGYSCRGPTVFGRVTAVLPWLLQTIAT